MQLPVRTQQVQPTTEQPAQPIAQAYDMEVQQAKQVSGDTLQAVGELVQKRADQLELQYRNSVLNSLDLQYTERATQKQRDLLSRQGLDAAGVAHEFNVYNQDLEKKTLDAITNPVDRETMRVKIERNKTQIEDQLAAHQIVQVRDANEKTIYASNKLDMMSVLQNPTIENIQSKRSAIQERISANIEVNGQSPELAKAIISQTDNDLITGVVQNFIQQKDYASAKNRLDQFADMVGGKDSATHKEITIKIDELKFDQEIGTTADDIVNRNFKKTSGLEDAFNEVESLKINDTEREKLLSKVNQRWSMATHQQEVINDRVTENVMNQLTDVQRAMRNGQGSPDQIMNKFLPQIKNLQFGKNPVDIKVVNALEKQLMGMVYSEDSRREALESRQASQENAAATRSLAAEARNARVEKQNQTHALLNTLMYNPTDIRSLMDMVVKFPALEFSQVESIGKAFGYKNTRDLQTDMPSRKIGENISTYLENFKTTDEQLKVLGDIAKYVNNARVQWANDHTGQDLMPTQIDMMWNKAITDSAIVTHVGWIKNTYKANYEIPQDQQFNGQTWRIVNNKLVNVQKKPSMSEKDIVPVYDVPLSGIQFTEGAPML